jgi:hypothetical protein
MSMLQPMLRQVWLATRPSTSRQGARWPRVAGPGVQCALRLLLLGVTVVGLGCAGARVEVAQQAPSDAPQPDFLIVERFAVSPWDVKLDRGLSAKALRGLQERDLNEEEQQVGAAVATIAEEETVRLLRQAGIPAYLDSYAPTATRTTALLQGQFLSVDEGDRTQRVWIGFGLGGAKLQIKMQVLQGGLMVAEGEVQTTSSLKPGMVASLGVGAATGSIGMAAAIGGGMAVASEPPKPWPNALYRGIKTGGGCANERCTVSTDWPTVPCGSSPAGTSRQTK